MRYSQKMYIVMLLLSGIFTFFKAQEFWELANKKEQELSTFYAERIQNVAHDIVDDARVLQEIFALQPGELTESYFENVARVVYKSQYYIFISYQPKGVVQFIYPKDAYEWLVGRDVLEAEQSRVDAQFAKQSGRTILTGPYKTGNLEAIISRRPVYEFIDGKRTFWGFISVGFDVKKMLRDVIEIDAMAAFNYEFGLFTIYKGNPIEVGRSENFVKDEKNKRVFTVGDQTWSLYLYDTGKLKQLYVTILTFFVSCTALATIMYIIVNKFEQKHLQARKLNYLDPLTKAYNRKMVDEFMEQRQIGAHDAFTVFYLDLNDFKPVNDIHGHDVGDKLLIAFVERTRHNFKADSVLARMGGDEFALVLQQELSEHALQSIIQRIDTLSKKPFYIDGIDLHVSSSIGYGQYPAEGKDMGEILAMADERMYAWKKRIKAERAAKGQETR